MTEEELRRRFAELEVEITELRAERRELRDIFCAKAPPAKETTEEGYLKMMRNHVPRRTGNRRAQEVVIADAGPM